MGVSIDGVFSGMMRFRVNGDRNRQTHTRGNFDCLCIQIQTESLVSHNIHADEQLRLPVVHQGKVEKGYRRCLGCKC